MKVKTATGYVHVRIPPKTAEKVEIYIEGTGFPMSFSTAVNFLLGKALEKAIEIQDDCHKAIGGKRK